MAALALNKQKSQLTSDLNFQLNIFKYLQSTPGKLTFSEWKKEKKFAEEKEKRKC